MNILSKKVVVALKRAVGVLASSCSTLWAEIFASSVVVTGLWESERVF